jgi:hypothetical protein
MNDAIECPFVRRTVGRFVVRARASRVDPRACARHVGCDEARTRRQRIAGGSSEENSMRHFSFQLAASLVALAALTGPAAATNAKEYTGSWCLASTGSDNASLYRTGSGRVQSTSAGTVTVMCNAVKDDASIASATMWVIDNSATEAVTCHLRSVQHDTTAVWQDDDVTSVGGYSSSATQLTFGSLSAEDYGGYVFVCDLPATYNTQRSGIVTYRIVEND